MNLPSMAQNMAQSMAHIILATTDLFPSLKTAMGVWPYTTSAFHTIYAYFTSAQAITAGLNILVLVPIVIALIGCIRLFATGRGVLLTSCYYFTFAGVDWFYSWGLLYYHLLGLSFTVVLLAALHVYIIEGEIGSEILWLYRALDYIGIDGGLHQYSSSRLQDKQRIRRARRYQQRPVPPAPSPAEIEAQAARFRQLQDRCERARILAYPLRPVVPARADAVGLENAVEPGEVLAIAPVNANSLAEPGYGPENTEGRTAQQIDLDKRSGRYLLQWLAREIQESEGFVVPVRWSQCKKTGEITCDNGYTQGVSIKSLCISASKY